MRKLERFVLEKPLDFEYVINGAIGACESNDRRIIVVGGFFKLGEYFRIKKAINEHIPKIKVSYIVLRP